MISFPVLYRDYMFCITGDRIEQYQNGVQPNKYLIMPGVQVVACTLYWTTIY